MRKLSAFWFGILFLSLPSFAHGVPSVYTLGEDEIRDREKVSDQIEKDLRKVSTVNFSALTARNESLEALRNRMKAVVGHILAHPDPDGQAVLPSFYLNVIPRIARATLGVFSSISLVSVYGEEIERVLDAFHEGNLNVEMRSDFLSSLFELIERSEQFEDLIAFGNEGVRFLGGIVRNPNHLNHEKAYQTFSNWLTEQRSVSIGQGPFHAAWQSVFQQMTDLAEAYCRRNLE